MIHDLAQDLRFALRTMRHQPGHTSVAILTLAVGIGASTAIFSLVNAIVLRPLPFRDPDRLVLVETRRVADNKRPFTIPDYVDYREQNRTLEGLAAYTRWSANLTGRGEPERLQGMRISANAFELLGVRAAVGRALRPEDDTPGREHVVLLSDAFWRRRFAADPGCVGQSLVLNDEVFTIAGVLPPDFISPVRDAEITIPLAPDTDPLRHVRTSVNFLRGIGRLRAGVPREQAEADLTRIQLQLARLYPDGDGAKIGLMLTPLAETIVGDFRVTLWTLLGAVGVLLLIACVNLANLALVRAAARRHEFAVRTAVGATGGRLVRQLVTESLVLAAFGGAAGVFLALWSVPLLLRLNPQGLPRTAEVAVDLPVLGFALALTLVAGVIFGLAPAWNAMRVDLHAELKEDGRGTSGGPRRDRARRLLVVGETALSVLLLIAAALLVQSFAGVSAVPPGFDAERVLTVRLSLPQARYPDRATLLRFHDALEARLASAPGVEAAGSVSILPLSGMLSAVDFTIDGREARVREVLNTSYRIADGGYFKAMGIPVLAGRAFDARDRDGTPAAALVSRSFAERFWPKASPIGARVHINDNEGPPRPIEIVGVVGDVKHEGLDAESKLMLYVAAAQLHPDQVAQYGGSQFWVVRTKADPASLSGAVRDAIAKVDPLAPAANLRPLAQYVETSVAPREFSMRLLVAFAVVALALAGMGLYGVIAHGVAQRRRELAIRVALGAQRGDLLRLVVGQAMRVSAIGVALGLVAAYFLTRLMASLLFGVSATDPPTFAAIAVLQMAVALMACWLPASRAAQADPLGAMR